MNGGTKKVLEENNIRVTSISEITGIDSVMDGRVKTLDSKIFGSILADRGNSNHLEDLDMIGGSQIDVVVVNFYPFEENAVKKNLINTLSNLFNSFDCLSTCSNTSPIVMKSYFLAISNSNISLIMYSIFTLSPIVTFSSITTYGAM